jgi:Flp pilus assembly protein TadG
MRRLVSIVRPIRPRGDSGQSLLEFAIVGTLFMLLTLGIVEMGRAVWTYNSLAHAAREGTRWAIVRGQDSGRTVVSGDVQTYVEGLIASFDPIVVTTTWNPNKNPGSVVQVQVQHTFAPVVPLFPSIALTATSRMVIAF